MYTHKRGVKNLFLSYCQSPYKYFFGIFKMQENWDFWKVALIGTGHFFETFRAEIYACFSVLFFAHVDIPTSARYRVMVVWLLYRKENRFHISVFCKFHQFYVYTTTHVLFFISHVYFYAGVDIAHFRFHIYLIVNPKREFEFKMTSTVGLHKLKPLTLLSPL